MKSQNRDLLKINVKVTARESLIKILVQMSVGSRQIQWRVQRDEGYVRVRSPLGFFMFISSIIYPQ